MGILCIGSNPACLFYTKSLLCRLGASLVNTFTSPQDRFNTAHGSLPPVGWAIVLLRCAIPDPDNGRDIVVLPNLVRSENTTPHPISSGPSHVSTADTQPFAFGIYNDELQLLPCDTIDCSLGIYQRGEGGSITSKSELFLKH